MKKRIVLATAALLGMAACDSAPTISADGTTGSLDGGVIFGSGNRSGSDSTSAAAASNGENADATTEEGRGGVVFGSGN
jgi:hypothetical protein